ncbi:hypothetical protein C4K20_1776 [Pseudomonas chlororaphis subsp. aurantiaca]|nr:hypothetical protein C4K20_1776 [Pseudomonas chlororaphis subsp. aurantiaca]
MGVGRNFIYAQTDIYLDVFIQPVCPRGICRLQVDVVA